MSYKIIYPDELYHFGVKGMKWGVRKDKKSSIKDLVKARRYYPKDKTDAKKYALAKASITTAGYAASLPLANRYVKKHYGLTTNAISVKTGTVYTGMYFAFSLLNDAKTYKNEGYIKSSPYLKKWNKNE